MHDYGFDINIDGKMYKVPIICECKKRKTLVLRIIPKNMQVIFSMPVGTPKSYADSFFEKSKPWLAKQLEKILPCVKIHDYMENDSFYYLGSELPLKIRSGRKNSAHIEGGCIFIEQKTELSADQKKALLEKMFTRELEDLLKESFSYVSQKFKQYIGEREPDIKIRKMTAKWGLCRPLKNQMTFSSRLVHVSPELIDYVMAHELCHFVHANHSKAFWALLEKGMPAWCDFRQKLGEMDKYIDI